MHMHLFHIPKHIQDILIIFSRTLSVLHIDFLTEDSMRAQEELEARMVFHERAIRLLEDEAHSDCSKEEAEHHHSTDHYIRIMVSLLFFLNPADGTYCGRWSPC